MNEISLFTSILLLSAIEAMAASVNASDGGKPWRKEQVKVLKAARKVDAVNQYGGYTKRKLKATGFFQTLEKSGKWWMVDPEGHPFIMIGLNSVEAGRVGRYDSEEWAKETYALMKENGFNTMGRWSESDAFKAAGVPVPWCNTTSFAKEYDKRRPLTNGERGFPNETLPVFDPEWLEFCKRYAEDQVSHLQDDHWLIGHFSDNEIPFRPDALEKYLSLPSDDAGYKGAVVWMRENKVKQSKVKDEEVQMAFLKHVARLYYETVASALKKADPNHLYLGSRLHGRCINEATVSAAGACDIISINYYHRWEPEEDRMEDWEAWSGRPFFVSEFYAMKVSRKDIPSDVGAGFRVLNHEDAAAFYHTHTVSLLKDVPSCVGWHWFKYADDTPEWQKGIISKDGNVHQILLNGMKVINEQAYALRGLR
ncbi:hypothetical protein P4B35_15545 [Pontiellaceae bacterium B12227]|nr:hypothetical protein [Pontiellaceae bacterium B12227]